MQMLMFMCMFISFSLSISVFKSLFSHALVKLDIVVYVYVSCLCSSKRFCFFLKFTFLSIWFRVCVVDCIVVKYMCMLM